MNPPTPRSAPASVSPRREFLGRLGGGLGSVALAQLLGVDQVLGGDTAPAVGRPTGIPLAHHRPRVRRVIQLFMNGGASQMDLFDYKPELEKQHGMKLTPEMDYVSKPPPANRAR